MCFRNKFLLILNFLMISDIIGKELPHQNDWTVKEWWSQNRDFGNRIKKLKFTGLSKKELYSPRTSIETSNGNEVQTKPLPETTIKSINKTILEYFSMTRSHQGDWFSSIVGERPYRVKGYYKKVKSLLKKHFVKLGLTTALQSFWPPEMRKDRSNGSAHNIIGIWPGRKRGTEDDQILIIGAHWDSVSRAPGVEDNGSGSAAVLEVAKLITQNNCKLDTTLIFSLFDLEEDGLKGSKHFIKDYLIPIEINKNEVKYMGAIVMDMIMKFDPNPKSQDLGNFGDALPQWKAKVAANEFRGDFIGAFARKGIDTHLFDILKRNWLNDNIYKLYLMAPPLPEFGDESNEDTYDELGDFIRSDHASFWYPTQRNLTFATIKLHDLGPWRGSVANTYHSSEDDTRQLTEENLLFEKNTIDSVFRTVLDLGKGKCFY